MHSLRNSLFWGFLSFSLLSVFLLAFDPFSLLFQHVPTCSNWDISNRTVVTPLPLRRGGPPRPGPRMFNQNGKYQKISLIYIELSLSHDITIFSLWYFVVSFDTQTSKAKEFVECYWKWESLWYMKGMQTPKEENVTENGQLWHSCGCGIWDRIPCVFLPLHWSQFKAVLAPWHADIQQFARRSEMRLPQTFKH